MDDDEKENSSVAFAIDLTSGIFGGCAGVIVGHPFDTLKVRLQTQTQHRGMLTVFGNIIRNEGYRGLYKGLLSPMAGVAAVNSLLFAVYGSAIRLTASDPEKPSVGDVFIAGSISGLFNGFFSCPMELIKIRLQNQTDTKSRLYNGPIDCIKKIVKAKGFKGFFKGLPTTIARETPSYGAYFASYDLFCKLLPNSDPNQPSLGLLVAGGIAGIVGWLTTYPLDFVKTRLQSIQEDQKPRYKTMMNAIRIISREEGYRVFFSGLTATAIRAFPTNAATFYVVVSVRNFLESNI